MGKDFEWEGPKWSGTYLWLLAISVLAIAVVALVKAGGEGVAKPEVLYYYAAKDKGDDLSPTIAFGNGRWVVVWSSDDNLNNGKKADLDILISSSKDGQSWGAPQLLVKNPALAKGNDFTPSIATDGQKNWAVVWSSTVPELKAYGQTLTIKDDLDILIARSEDNGKTWKDLKPLNRNADSDSPYYYSGSPYKKKAEGDWNPRLVTNGKYWVVVWTGDSRVIHVKGAACSDYLKPTKVYFQYTDNITYVAGSPWFGPYCIGSSEADYDAQVAGDGKGNWVLAWASLGNTSAQVLGADTDILFAQAKQTLWSVPDPAVKWSSPAAMVPFFSSDGESDESPSVATDGKGNWLAVWSSRVPKVTVNGKVAPLKADADLLVARSKDNGKTWTGLKMLNTNAATDKGDDLLPHIATDGGGNWVVVWVSGDDLGGPLGTDRDILMASSTDNGQSWSAPKALHSNASSDSGEDTGPQIATDGKEWVVVWQSDEDGGSGKDKDILFARFSLP